MHAPAKRGPIVRLDILYLYLSSSYIPEVVAQTNAGGTRISGGAVAGIVIGAVVLIILLILAFASPYSPWRREQQEEGAEAEASVEKGGFAGNPAFNNAGGAAPGAPEAGVNPMQMQANGLGGGFPGAPGYPAQSGGAMHPQMVAGTQQQRGYGMPAAQQFGTNNAPYVPTFAAPSQAYRGY